MPQAFQAGSPSPDIDRPPPLPLRSNPACASANWTDINFPACNTILEDDAADSACPAECEEALGKVPTPCVDALVADLQVGGQGYLGAPTGVSGRAEGAPPGGGAVAA